MDFVDIENAGKRMFEQFPAVKKSLKRVYQLTSYALSTEKFKSEGDLVQVTPDDITGHTYMYDNTWKSSSEKIKRRIMQIGTSIIGEDLRYKLVEIKNHN